MNIQPVISVKNKTSGERKKLRLDEGRGTIGRDQSNFIVLDGKSISRRHAEIVQEGAQFFIRDLKSNNGTKLNERPLPPEEKILLKPGDIIQIEGFDLIFTLPNASEVEDIYEITDTDLLEIKMVKKLIRAMDRENAPSFEVLEGAQAGVRFLLEEKNQEILIGRDPACEFVIDSDVISRKHARVEKRFDTIVIHDLGSKNGLFVNRERVKEKRLADSDIIQLGTLPLSFRNPQELSFDLEPPKPPPKKEPTTGEVAAESSAPSVQMPDARSAGRSVVPRESSYPPEEALPEAPFEGDLPAPVPFGLKVSPMEIVAVAIGLLVLIGSIWGILKLL